MTACQIWFRSYFIAFWVSFSMVKFFKFFWYLWYFIRLYSGKLSLATLYWMTILSSFEVLFICFRFHDMPQYYSCYGWHMNTYICDLIPARPKTTKKVTLLKWKKCFQANQKLLKEIMICPSMLHAMDDIWIHTFVIWYQQDLKLPKRSHSWNKRKVFKQTNSFYRISCWFSTRIFHYLFYLKHGM